ncbi:hypothetical protein [Anaerorhabdus sp.]|uniref:hypothetical protein n=1 Tax=Anaerorhabdus sp. TaxID=1872524 RepID=UPI002FC97A76
MKSSIQIYGIIVVSSVFLFLFPQLLGLAMLYRQANSIASYLVEVIEVHEGVTSQNGANDVIQDELKKVPKLICTFGKEKINNFYTYTVDCNKESKISILNIPIDIRVSKKTRRVIY